jgi:hypothetical protein
MRIGAGEIAFDHRLDVELTDFVPLAVAMDPHHANPPFSISVLDQRHSKSSGSMQIFYVNRDAWFARREPDHEQRSCQQASLADKNQALREKSGRRSDGRKLQLPR